MSPPYWSPQPSDSIAVDGALDRFVLTRLRVKRMPLGKRATEEASKLLGLSQLQRSQVGPDFPGTDLCRSYAWTARRDPSVRAARGM